MATGSFRLRAVVLAGLLASTCVLTTPASGAAPAVVGAVTFTPIDQPTPEYTSGTCVYDLSGIPNGRRVRKLLGCGKVTLDPAFGKKSVPESFPSWGSPPDTETDTPDVLVTAGGGASSLDVRRTETAGVEVAAAPGESALVTVFFRSRNTLLGQIERFVPEDEARLFAATVTGGVITTITVTNNSTLPYAIANLRVVPPS